MPRHRVRAIRLSPYIRPTGFEPRLSRIESPYRPIIAELSPSIARFLSHFLKGSSASGEWVTALLTLGPTGPCDLVNNWAKT